MKDSTKLQTFNPENWLNSKRYCIELIIQLKNHKAKKYKLKLVTIKIETIIDFLTHQESDLDAVFHQNYVQKLIIDEKNHTKENPQTKTTNYRPFF